jgi:hypothetical protein
MYLVLFSIGIGLARAGNCAGGMRCRHKRRIVEIPEEEEYWKQLLVTTQIPEVTTDHRPQVVETSIDSEPGESLSLTSGHRPDFVDSILPPVFLGPSVEIPATADTVCTLPARGAFEEFTCRGFHLKVLSGFGNSVPVSIILDDAAIQWGRLEVRTDCIDNHDIDKITYLSTRLNAIGLSQKYILTTPGVFVDHDDILGCDRYRKAIVWPQAEGSSLWDMRRRTHKDIDIKLAFSIGLKITEMIEKLHGIGVAHGSLSPANIFIIGHMHFV